MNKRAVKLDVNEVAQTKPLSFEEQTGQNQVLEDLYRGKQESNTGVWDL